MLASKRLQAEVAKLRHENARLERRHDAQQEQIGLLLYQVLTMKEQAAQAGLQFNFGEENDGS